MNERAGPLLLLVPNAPVFERSLAENRLPPPFLLVSIKEDTIPGLGTKSCGLVANL